MLGCYGCLVGLLLNLLLSICLSGLFVLGLFGLVVCLFCLLFVVFLVLWVVFAWVVFGWVCLLLVGFVWSLLFGQWLFFVCGCLVGVVCFLGGGFVRGFILFYVWLICLLFVWLRCCFGLFCFLLVWFGLVCDCSCLV